MAYCLRSFVETLDQVLNPHKHHKTWVLDPEKKPQIQSLFDNASFLQDFLDNSSALNHKDIENEIMEDAEKALDILEIHITNQVLSTPKVQTFRISPPDLGEVINVFEIAKQKVIKIKDVGQPSNQIVSPPVSSTRDPDSKNVVVGVEDVLEQLKKRLTCAQVTKLHIIPIVGMGGMGKTTLARLLYDEYASRKSVHFDRCAWATVSQSYDVQEILQTLLDCITGNPKRVKKLKEEQLDEEMEKKAKEEKVKKIRQLTTTLHKALDKIRYLIVLDDIWSCEAWDALKMAFPQNGEGNRVILTSREKTLPDYVKSDIHQMSPINEVDSWKLLRKIAFAKEGCPSELEGFGKEIAKKCKGLPLALQVIGGLLSQLEKNKDLWEQVASDVSASIVKKDDRFAEIFTWSFDYLPHYLKPCFLYMGAFPEDQSIRASKIIRLWVAEGFLKPINDQSPEEAAEAHLDALVNRNLIFVRGKRRNRKPKTYGIHDLLRDMCLRKAQEKKFLFVKDSTTINSKDPTTINSQGDMVGLRRVSVHSSYIYDKHFSSLKLTPHARSFLLIRGGGDKLLSTLCFMFSLLRVLDLLEVQFQEFPEIILRLVNLRYLAINNSRCSLPKTISILQNLQTLVSSDMKSLALLADMPHLRHLKFHNLYEKSDKVPLSLHENLQSLSNVPVQALSELLGKFPNLKKLEIDGSDYYDVDLTCFGSLETFKCSFGFFVKKGTSTSNITFPKSLKKLTFYSCGLPESLLEAIALLPNLKILKLAKCVHMSPVWEPREDGFPELEYLHIEGCRKLESWSAREYTFSVLQHLVLRNCPYLSEIPSEIGEIDTLEIIEVDKCKSSVFDSARLIHEKQSGLQLQLGSELKNEEKGVEEGVEELETLNRKVKNHELSLEYYNFSGKTIFPHSLKKMTLKFCKVPQAILNAIGVLPDLQVLKIKHCVLESSTWEPSEGKFSELQYLKLAGLHLEKWLATDIHFPVLQHLVLKYCLDLNEIPSGIEGTETLEIIDVDYCRASVFDSARRISEKRTRLQLQLGHVYEPK